MNACVEPNLGPEEINVDQVFDLHDQNDNQKSPGSIQGSFYDDEPFIELPIR
ncbi:MAG: hypothetical protein P1U40_10950 [Coxiellaceae bacterium]|nr:hypothetical protein [Coxiellaceae bacterium]